MQSWNAVASQSRGAAELERPLQRLSSRLGQAEHEEQRGGNGVHGDARKTNGRNVSFA